jgi:hypothetical protein
MSTERSRPSRQPRSQHHPEADHTRNERHRLLAGLIAFTALTSACGTGTGFAPPVVDREAAAQSDADNLTVEEAGLLASGQLIDVYGLDADPVPMAVESRIVEFDGQMVWQLELVVDLGENGRRVRHEWRMWIGTPIAGPPDVLRAQRRR